MLIYCIQILTLKILNYFKVNTKILLVQYFYETNFQHLKKNHFPVHIFHYLKLFMIKLVLKLVHMFLLFLDSVYYKTNNLNMVSQKTICNRYILTPRGNNENRCFFFITMPNVQTIIGIALCLITSNPVKLPACVTAISLYE